MPVASCGLLREVDFVGKVGLRLDPVEWRIWITFSKMIDSLNSSRVVYAHLAGDKTWKDPQ